MSIDDQIRNEKLQNGINRENTKISTLSWGKIEKYRYLTDEEILRSNQKQIIEQVKSLCSLLVKVLEKQAKTIEDQEKNKLMF